ncbi:MAG: hypothetical protein KatS3mg101_0573 [Patescibacteria group bacterium]|nr:MAG: hypothetical protein KatS3mg101_0573 [Patescibacteria group bacterium]
MEKIDKVIKSRGIVSDTRNKHEFQAYGNRLAEELNDRKHRSLYIKLAKTEDRTLLEAAREFVLGSEKATTKGRLFMWKLSELKKQRLNKKSE